MIEKGERTHSRCVDVLVGGRGEGAMRMRCLFADVGLRRIYDGVVESEIVNTVL